MAAIILAQYFEARQRHLMEICLILLVAALCENPVGVCFLKSPAGDGTSVRICERIGIPLVVPVAVDLPIRAGKPVIISLTPLSNGAGR
jgi:hypothetical protein